jgi:hypothetical protein
MPIKAHMTREFRALAHPTLGTLRGGPFDSTFDPMLLRDASRPHR